ncbi:glycosyltransferase family 8 protein [Pectinatus sottacetonis]|uniref:glycosyltransferase family 8 protein n=1 Tax=Pectinatus sottacetonis TaxID=1002795 RepID=UPI0018C7E501|nr:glycosyltransferase family 8 protein [Pectinatus sottacetonis]
MEKSNVIHIALGVNNKYFPYAGVLMTSILLNSFKEHIVFHVAFSEKPSKINKEKKDKFNLIYNNANIIIYDLSEQIDKLPNLSIYTSKRFDKSILLRILLPDVIDKDIKKLLYLDADILCIGNIKELWQIDIENFILGACPYKKKHGPEQIKRLGLNTNLYFNSGVLLINMEKWRVKNITDIIIDCYNKFYEFFLLPDQDAINVVLQNNIYCLPYKFNRMTAPNDPTLDLCEKGDILIHFVNEAKPWIDGNTIKFDKMYKLYVSQSLWNDIEFIIPDSVELMILAGRNYEEKKDYKKATYYYGTTAQKLMKYYLDREKL